MKILLSNDDGIHAPGIQALKHALKPIVDRVTLVAPDRDRSGASNSLTLDMPIRVKALNGDELMVEGTPTDCVHLAITGLLDELPDMVISGINASANLGDDILYSGTVAAATEGRFLGLPAIAVSLVGSEPSHLNTAVQVTLRILEQLKTNPLPADTILNINVPDVPLDQIQGYAVTRLGSRHRAEPIIKDRDPRGRLIYWVGPSGAAADNGPGTDFEALAQGKVSITPLKVDMTNHSAMQELQGWVGAL